MQRARHASRRTERSRIHELRLAGVRQRIIELAARPRDRREACEQTRIARVVLESFHVLRARSRIVERDVLKIRAHCQRAFSVIARKRESVLGGDARALHRFLRR